MENTDNRTWNGELTWREDVSASDRIYWEPFARSALWPVGAGYTHAVAWLYIGADGERTVKVRPLPR